jgi:hypothetical protein
MNGNNLLIIHSISFISFLSFEARETERRREEPVKVKMHGRNERHYCREK